MLVIEFCGYVGNDAEIKEFNGQKFISFNVATYLRALQRRTRQHSKPHNVDKLFEARRKCGNAILEKRNTGICKGRFFSQDVYERERCASRNKLPGKRTSIIGNEAGSRAGSARNAAYTSDSTTGTDTATGIR